MDQSYESLRARVGPGRIRPVILLLPLAVLLVVAGPARAQVCEGDVTLTTQAEVDAFACTEVTGSLLISGGDIASLAPLAGLVAVGSGVAIRNNPLLASLEGLEGLSSLRGEIWEEWEPGYFVSSSLIIRNNDALTSLEGLDGLSRVGHTEVYYCDDDIYGDGEVLHQRGFVVADNEALTSLAGLSSLTSVEGSFFISGNPVLTSLAGLETVSSVAVDLVIEGNAALTSLEGLTTLSSIGRTHYGPDIDHGSLVVRNNTSLVSLAGLEGFASTSGGLHLVIQNNPSLVSLAGLEAFTSLGGLHIRYNPSLVSLAGLENLSRLESERAYLPGCGHDSGPTWVQEGGLHVVGNPSLASLAGLDGLSFIRGGLVIGYNRSLASLAAFEGLSWVGGDLILTSNPELASLIELEDVSSVGGGLLLENNAALTTLTGLDSLASVGSFYNDTYRLIGYRRPTFSVRIAGNASLTSIEELARLSTLVVDSDEYPSGSMIIEGNPVLMSLKGLEGLSAVHSLRIASNAALRSLEGLEAVSTLQGGLLIENNDALVSLTGLDNLSVVGTSFGTWGDPSFSVRIVDNAALTSLTGLESLISVERLDIQDNPALEGCSCGLAGLISDGAFVNVGDVEIRNNAPGGRCNAPEQVLATPCDAGPGDSTPPVCGAVDLVTSGGHAIAVEVSPSDTESGIRKVAFPTLSNATAQLDGTVGPFTEGQLHAFDAPYPASFTMRADKIDPAAPFSVVIDVTNGAGLTSTCHQTAACLEASSNGLLGHVRSVGGYPVAIDVQDYYAYVGDWNSRHGAGIFQVIDVADPCAPEIKWSHPTTDPGHNEIGDLAVRGNYAFLANDANGLAVYDISDPLNPSFVTRKIVGAYTKSVNLFRRASDDKLYASVTYNYPERGELGVYDLGDLPSLGEGYWYDSSIGYQGWDSQVVGDRLYLFTDGATGLVLQILDIGNLSEIALLGHVVLPASTYGNIGEIRVVGQYAYLAMSDDRNHQGGLRVIDISDDTRPQVVASYDIPAGHVPWFGVGLAVSGERAYIAARDFLYVFDISNPLHPSLVTTFAYPDTFNSTSGGRVVVRDGLAYVVAFGDEENAIDHGGLAIFRVSSKPAVDQTPPVCGSINVEKDASGVLIAVSTTAFDLESGIQRANFLRLHNLHGFLDAGNGWLGPFQEEDVRMFDPATTSSIAIRGERIDLDGHGAIVVRVTNGAGLKRDCDPVLQTLTAEVPEAFALEQNYPNPFNPQTTIRFSLPEAGHVQLAVYDAMGRRVATLIDEGMQAGTYEAVWNGRSDSGTQVAGGLYFYTIEAGTFKMTRSMVLLK